MSENVTSQAELQPAAVQPEAAEVVEPVQLEPPEPEPAAVQPEAAEVVEPVQLEPPEPEPAAVQPEAAEVVEPAQLGPPEPELEPGPAAEEELDAETAARRAAALSHVRKFGDPVLRTRARPVERFDDTLRDEVRRMGDLMVDAIGVGLAATQVGVLHRLLVYRVHQQAPVVALVNPEIEWTGGEQETLEEGCLSLPAVHVDVERPVHVRVTALDEYGQPITVEASGLEARVIQHEIDHLDGILVLDRISRSQRKEAMRALREALQAA